MSAYVDRFGSAEAANRFYSDLDQLLEENEDGSVMKTINEGTMKMFNFDVLVGNAVNSYEVAALVIGVQKAEGTYITPVKPLQTLHKWLLTEHNVQQDTASTRLNQLVGDMRPLAQEVLQIKETEALLDVLPAELKDADPTYWAAVRDYGYCVIIEERTDCAQYLVVAEARAWENPDPEDFHHVDPPGEVWPPADFLIPKAYAGHAQVTFTTSKYSAYSYVRNCGDWGDFCYFVDKTDKTASGYNKITYEGRDHIYGTSVIVQMKVEATGENLYGSVAYVKHWPCGDVKSDSDDAPGSAISSAYESTVIGSNPNSTCTYNDGSRLVGYGLKYVD